MEIGQDTAHEVKETFHRGVVGVESATAHAASSAVEGTLKSLSMNGDALLLGTGLSAAFTQWDYIQARDNIRRQYELELAAKTGKPYSELTNKDLDAAGQKNVVINDALKRARTKRNIGIVAGALAVTAALVVASAVVAPAVVAALGGAVPATLGAAFSGGLSALSTAAGAGKAALFLTKAVTVGAASVATYMGTEEATMAVGEKLTGIRQPSIKEATRDPRLQDKLSPSSQITLIEHLQKRVHVNKPQTYISQEQVFKAFLATNKGMGDDIQRRYGANFSSLPPEQRVEILSTVGKALNLEQVTSDLNHRQIRAQELAFMVQGESSGVPRHEAPRVTALEKAHMHMAHELDEARQVIGSLKQRVKSTEAQLNTVTQARQDSPAPSAPDAPMLQNNKEAIGPATGRLLAQRNAATRQRTGNSAALG